MNSSPNRSARCPAFRLLSIALLSLIVVVLTWSRADAATRRVPEDFATIQSAIVAAQNGDVVLVAPGTYFENINFLGKAIEVKSEGGPATTIIDGGLVDVVVTITSQETTSSVLSGFTLTRGLGGAIRTGYESSPTISGNVVTGNRVCGGAGIAAIWIANGGSPVVKDNLISSNRCDPGVGGAGIAILSSSATSGPQILRNVISNHFESGIYILGGGIGTIQGNTIKENGSAFQSDGGGISIGNFSDVNIINNVIVGNTARRGGGISWLVPSGTRGPLLINNTIAANDSAQGSGIYADGFDVETLFVNNVVVAKTGQTAIYCGNFNDTNPPIIQFNDVFSVSGSPYGGFCADQTGLNGNISRDPAFVDASTGNYRLRAGSPAINAGTNSAPILPVTDKDGRPRVMGGVVDMGAFEFEFPAPSTPIPTVGEWGLISLATLLALFGVVTVALRSKRDRRENSRI